MIAERIFMTGESGDHNLGDEGMALASACRLRRYFPDAQLVATGLDPLGAVLRHQAHIVPWPLSPYDLDISRAKKITRRFARKIGAGEGFLDPVARPMDVIFDEQYRGNSRFRQVLEELEQADLVFDMGHGALNDVFDPFMLCFLYYLAGRLRKPLFISGQSIGPLWRSRSIKMVRETLAYAHTVGLRDKGVSHQALVEQVGIDTNCVRLVEVGDDTLDLIPQQPTWSDFAPHVADILRSDAFFAVQWRPTDYTQHLGATEGLVPLADAIKYLCQTTGLPAVFLPFSWELAGSDTLVAARICDHLKESTPFHVAWNYLDAAELKWLLARARFGLGLSYHFHVFLLSQGVPSIGFYTNPYYDIKLRGVYAAYGYKMAPLAYSPDLCTTSEFDTAIETVADWADADRRLLKLAADEMRSRWHEAFQAFLRDNKIER